MDLTEEVSRLAKLGESMTCMTMAGTPPKMVMRSRSMSSRARSGSKWCIMTSLPPAAVLVTSTAWQPVAWNRGTDKRLAFWVPAPVPDSCRAASEGTDRGDEEQVHQVGHAVAVGSHRPLGPAGGARGVEDGGVGVGIDGHVGQGPAARAAQRSVRRRGRRARDLRRDARPRSPGPPDGHPSGPGSSQQTTRVLRSGVSPRWGRIRSRRSSSAKTTLVPESLRP